VGSRMAAPHNASNVEKSNTCNIMYRGVCMME
jgi:hypothetical protein